MAKPKPKGWNAMSKTKQEAWKKANFDTSTKVTEAQLTKLRQAGTPTAAIAKYANDPSMREALNRFYGKDKVNAVKGSSAVTAPKGPVRGGPGAKMTPRPSGGPGAKMTARDGRSSTAIKKSGGPSVGSQVGAAAAAVGVAAVGAKAITRGGPGAKKVGKHAAVKGGRHAAPKGADRTAGSRTPKHAAPKTSPKMEALKYKKKTVAKRAAAKTTVVNKMKAQGAKIASSATSRYNTRGKK
jgi:hypothetical protein